MKHNTVIRSMPALSVRTGCRAGFEDPRDWLRIEMDAKGKKNTFEKLLCERGCLNDRDARSISCGFRGWPKDGICNQNGNILDTCLTLCD